MESSPHEKEICFQCKTNLLSSFVFIKTIKKIRIEGVETDIEKVNSNKNDDKVREEGETSGDDGKEGVSKNVNSNGTKKDLPVLFKCNDCSMTFEYSIALKHHIKKFHKTTGENNKNVKLVKKKKKNFVSSSKIRKTALKFSWTCQICCRKFGSEKNLNVHMNLCLLNCVKSFE